MTLRKVDVQVTVLAALLLLASSCALFESRDPNSVDDDPAWSPDGRMIAFVRTDSKRPGLYLVKPDGTGLRLLQEGLFYTPCWSPDSRWVVFSTRYDGRLFKVRVDGRGLMPLTDSADGYCYEADWSVAGRLVHQSSRSRPRGSHGVLWVMNADGSDKRDLSLQCGDSPSQPSWSPDGARIAVSKYYPGSPYTNDIAVIDSSGGSEVRLTTDGAENEDPDWCPAGNRMAFCAEFEYVKAVYVLDLDTGTRWRVADSGATSPSWSPDARRLCYSRRWYINDTTPEMPYEEHGKLWVVDADGRNAKQITY